MFSGKLGVDLVACQRHHSGDQPPWDLSDANWGEVCFCPSSSGSPGPIHALFPRPCCNSSQRAGHIRCSTAWTPDDLRFDVMTCGLADTALANTAPRR